MLHWAGTDFQVRMASELICPHSSFRALRLSAVRRAPVLVSVICEQDGHEVLQIELFLAETP